MAVGDGFSSWIELSPGETIRFGDLARLMATALHGESFAAAGAELNLEHELPKLVRAGVLTPRDPLGMGPHPFPLGAALKNARLRPDDELRAFLEDRGIGLRILPTVALEARPQRVPPELAALPDDSRVMFAGPTTAGVGNAGDLREMIEEAMARQKDGFFEVNEAAQVLAADRGGDWRDYKELLRRGWMAGIVRMREPGMRVCRGGADDRFAAHDWVSVDDVNAWLMADGCGYLFPAAPVAEIAAPSRQPDPAELDWMSKAKELGREIIARQRARDLYPSQRAIADEIARTFRTDGVVGADGKPLSGATIKRHALKGISSAVGRQLSTSPRRGKWGK